VIVDERLEGDLGQTRRQWPDCSRWALQTRLDPIYVVSCPHQRNSDTYESPLTEARALLLDYSATGPSVPYTPSPVESAYPVEPHPQQAVPEQVSWAIRTGLAAYPVRFPSFPIIQQHPVICPVILVPVILQRRKEKLPQKVVIRCFVKGQFPNIVEVDCKFLCAVSAMTYP